MAEGTLVFDDAPDLATAGGESGRSLVLVEGDRDHVILEGQANREVRELEAEGEFLVFDAPTARLETVEAEPDLVLLDPPPVPASVTTESGEPAGLVIQSGGRQGETGETGPAGTPTVTGMFDWIVPPGPIGISARGLGCTLEDGQVTGDEIGAGASQLQIVQTDKRGYNYSWMQMAPGDRVIIRENEDQGYHQLVITDRHAEGDQVIVDYLTMATTGTPVQGRAVEVIALGPEVTEEGELIPGPKGPPGPQGPPGEGDPDVMDLTVIFENGLV